MYTQDLPNVKVKFLDIGEHIIESQTRDPINSTEPWGLGGVVGLTLPMACADRGSRLVYYLPCSDLGQVVNLSLSVA